MEISIDCVMSEWHFIKTLYLLLFCSCLCSKCHFTFIKVMGKYILHVKASEGRMLTMFFVVLLVYRCSKVVVSYMANCSLKTFNVALCFLHYTTNEHV